MDVLGSQPPPRKGHLWQCCYHALEALTSLINSACWNKTKSDLLEEEPDKVRLFAKSINKFIKQRIDNNLSSARSRKKKASSSGSRWGKRASEWSRLQSDCQRGAGRGRRGGFAGGNLDKLWLGQPVLESRSHRDDPRFPKRDQRLRSERCRHSGWGHHSIKDDANPSIHPMW